MFGVSGLGFSNLLFHSCFFWWYVLKIVLDARMKHTTTLFDIAHTTAKGIGLRISGIGFLVSGFVGTQQGSFFKVWFVHKVHVSGAGLVSQVCASLYPNPPGTSYRGY